MKIRGRTFIVSGLATVYELSSLGAYVSILDRAPPPSAPESAALGDINPSLIKFFLTDVTETTSLSAAVTDTVAWTRETHAPLGGVINCAGVGYAMKVLDAKKKVHDIDTWDLVIKINLRGTFDLTRLVVKELVEVERESDGGEGAGDGERGVVIMVSSSAAFEGQPGQTAYSATKGAVSSMTLPMARDLGTFGIRVVTIAPGVFDSAMTAIFPAKVRKSLETQGVIYPNRFGRPSEFSRTVKWVLETPYVNGEVIRLSGGGRLPGKL